MAEHMRLKKIGQQRWECKDCHKTGTHTELNEADDCTAAVTTGGVGVEDCPMCQGIGFDCPACDGMGMVSVALAREINKSFSNGL